MLRLDQEAEGKILVIHASEKLTKANYQEFLPAIEQLIMDQGRIRVLLELHDFHGWTAGALWEDLKFDVRHFADIERLAIIGEQKWQAGMATFCKPFTTATIRYFDASHSQEAKDWIREGLNVSISA